MSARRAPEELAHLWRAWRENTRTMRNSYAGFVTLANQAARTNNFDNKGDLNLVEYGGSVFREQLSEAWTQLEPLYRQLHAYVRRKLRDAYGAHLVRERGPLPAHLLGDLWGQAWPLPYLLPFPDVPLVDVTNEMKRQGYTPRRIFEVADGFFASLGLESAPASFWRSSVLEDPKDTPVDCRTSSWDFCDGRDFRVKQCTKITQDDLVSAHHEMAHLQYFQQYRHLPYLYRRGPNPGFQEAIGLAVGLSVASQKYLRRIGLLAAGQGTSSASQLNTLMHLALRQLPFMPYARVLDQWRDGVLNGSIPREDWNCAWWDLRVNVQGVKPPEVRTERDFDPGAKFQVAADLSYTRYFVAFVLQFQVYQELCMAAGEFEPRDNGTQLHQCDFYQSTKAGDALRSMMQLGASVPWEEDLEVLTQGRETKLNAGAMREYYRPLEEWLTEQNKRRGEFVGWRADGEYCLYKKPFRATNCNLT
ncbi:angiotensin-converting enzyme-like [Eriocheir sinensis]|uniref:angiotensin-converting enzyme-like n=1 Tax=Eriocheir sinensis TaxID=95602 RepID=UPI0021C6E0E1|nr:angiotensin-converting enzyme-like [Eriocheir sinensis]